MSVRRKGVNGRSRAETMARHRAAAHIIDALTQSLSAHARLKVSARRHDERRHCQRELAVTFVASSLVHRRHKRLDGKTKIAEDFDGACRPAGAPRLGGQFEIGGISGRRFPGWNMVPQTGLEPVTPSLRMTCSTN